MLGVPRARPAPEAALPAVFGQLFGCVGFLFLAVAPAVFHGFLQPPPLTSPPCSPLTAVRSCQASAHPVLPTLQAGAPP